MRIEPGIYDHEATLERQRWDKKAENKPCLIVGSMNKRLIEEGRKSGMPFEPWGTYPDWEMPSVSMAREGGA